jgi:hypothetical protein
MAENDVTRLCPHCKEEIKADAIKCKHCGSRVAPARPAHGGTCPYCKDSIHPEAIRCKHCHSVVGGQPDAGCGCGKGVAGYAPEYAAGSPHAAVLGAPPGVGGGAAARWPLRCTARCYGPTLVCTCVVPGTNWISIFPCGSCIDDPTILV